MRQGRIESESEIRFFPLGNENDIGSKSQNENPFCGQSENPFCSSLGNENSFYSLGKSEKGKCGRAEIGHTAHAAKVQIVRIIQMNSRSEHKKMLDRGVWGVALPSRTHTITSCLLRFLSSVANPSKMGQSHTLPLFSPSFWDDATLASIRSTFPLNEPIVTIDFPVLGAFSTNGPIVVLFPHTTFDLRFRFAQSLSVYSAPQKACLYLTAHIPPLCPTSHHRTYIQQEIRKVSDVKFVSLFAQSPQLRPILSAKKKKMKKETEGSLATQGYPCDDGSPRRSKCSKR